MAEYIERAAAVCIALGAAALGNTAFSDRFEIAARLRATPAADVRPVVRGTWEEDCAGAAVCSVCGEYAFETSTHHLCGWFPNYCPNCGADMREES